jgi:hypothetical protein
LATAVAAGANLHEVLRFQHSQSEALQCLVTLMRGKGVLRIHLPKPAEVAEAAKGSKSKRTKARALEATNIGALIFTAVINHSTRLFGRKCHADLYLAWSFHF